MPVIQLQHYYGLCSLEIDRATSEDAGIYTVKASNPRGAVSCCAVLELEGLSVYSFTIRNVQPAKEDGFSVCLQGRSCSSTDGSRTDEQNNAVCCEAAPDFLISSRQSVDAEAPFLEVTTGSSDWIQDGLR